MVICKLFNNKWQSKESREALYLNAFSIDAWKALESEEREKHTLSECKACQEHHPQLANAFPTPATWMRKLVLMAESPSITFTEQDLTSTNSTRFDPTTPVSLNPITPATVIASSTSVSASSSTNVLYATSAVSVSVSTILQYKHLIKYTLQV